MKQNIRLFLGLSLAAMLSSCAIGTTKIKVTHDPLTPPATLRGGTILVKQFTDSRKDIKDPSAVGNKRNGFGMVLGGFAVKGGKTVAQTVTDHVADALRTAGYNAVVEGSGTAPGSPVLEGDVYEFWLDLFTATWHNVGIDLKLKRDGATVWQKRVSGSETNVLWLGINAEIEKVIRQAVNKALNQAVQEFGSNEFASKVK